MRPRFCDAPFSAREKFVSQDFVSARSQRRRCADGVLTPRKWPRAEMLARPFSTVYITPLSADMLSRTPPNLELTYFGAPYRFANKDKSLLRASTD